MKEETINTKIIQRLHDLRVLIMAEEFPHTVHEKGSSCPQESNPEY